MLPRATSPGHVPAHAATDSFGCPFDRLYRNQRLDGADITFFRKGTRDHRLEQVVTPASGRGFVVGVSTLGGHRRRIFHAHHTTLHHFEENALYVRDLSQPYKADLAGAFDFLLMEISPAGLERIGEQADAVVTTVLQAETAASDPVLANLARALMPALERPQEASRLFVDQLATVIGTHLVQRYGGRPQQAAPRSRKLSRAQENLARSLLLDHLTGDISIQSVADACGLSRGYFIHAFRETTGLTPHRWLMQARIGRARDMLRGTDASLSDIAISCGFADQSHFTRVFTATVGVPPGNWRRNA